ncbi:MAG: TetR/AcrR family transcriptional regulator [Acidobacteriota bacterium]
MRSRTQRGPRRSTREAILDTAALVLTESPSASMAALAQAAGVGRATLYRHFPSREELVKELSLEAIRLTDEATAPVFERYQNAATALREMIEALVPFGDRYHFLANETQAGADPQVASETNRQLSELAAFVDQAKTEGFFADDLPTEWIVAVIDSSIWAAWHSIHRGVMAPGDAARLVYRTLVDGLRQR